MKKPTAKIRNWSAVPGSKDPFKAPEIAGVSIAGEVEGHTRFADGERIVTGRVVAVDGRLITTESGSVYAIEGDPEPLYLEYLKTIGRVYDPVSPITIKQSPATGHKKRAPKRKPTRSRKGATT